MPAPVDPRLDHQGTPLPELEGGLDLAVAASAPTRRDRPFTFTDDRAPDDVASAIARADAALPRRVRGVAERLHLSVPTPTLTPRLAAVGDTVRVSLDRAEGSSLFAVGAESALRFAGCEASSIAIAWRPGGRAGSIRAVVPLRPETSQGIHLVTVHAVGEMSPVVLRGDAWTAEGASTGAWEALISRSGDAFEATFELPPESAIFEVEITSGKEDGRSLVFYLLDVTKMT